MSLNAAYPMKLYWSLFDNAAPSVHTANNTRSAIDSKSNDHFQDLLLKRLLKLLLCFLEIAARV